jgi:hypothetical protein
MEYLIQKKYENIFVALIAIVKFFHTSAQTTPEKSPEKSTELNEVAIIKTKKAIEQKADRTIFDFGDKLV